MTMEKSIQQFLLFNFLFFSTLTVQAITLVPTPPPLEATAYVLRDFHSGRVLAEKNADESVEPASLTKLMTAYIVFSKLKEGEIKLTDEVNVSEKAWKIIGSRMYLDVHSRETVEKLLKGMIIQSGNDASIALAEFIAGSEEGFVTLMNQQAKELGLTNTHYENTTGLSSDKHYTTADDLFKIASALIKDFPEFYKWYSEKEYTYNNITQSNRNLLLWRDKTVDGVKTGYTDKAGYCLIASAKREKMRLVSVVLGAKSKKRRATESQKLLDYGFRFFEAHELYRASEILNVERVWQGDTSKLKLGLKESLYVTVPKGQYDALETTVDVDEHILAPVKKGEKHGTLKVLLGNKVIAERPLVALHDVGRGNVFNWLIDYVWLQFQ